MNQTFESFDNPATVARMNYREAREFARWAEAQPLSEFRYEPSRVALVEDWLVIRACADALARFA